MLYVGTWRSQQATHKHKSVIDPQSVIFIYANRTQKITAFIHFPVIVTTHSVHSFNAREILSLEHCFCSVVSVDASAVVHHTVKSLIWSITHTHIFNSFIMMIIHKIFYLFYFITYLCNPCMDSVHYICILYSVHTRLRVSNWIWLLIGCEFFVVISAAVVACGACHIRCPLVW